MQAAKNGQEEIVIMLLQRGGNVHEKDRFDRTARWFAHRNGHLGIAALIKEAIQNKVAMDAAKPLDAEKRA
jgi:ankyrin repeat protein